MSDMSGFNTAVYSLGTMSKSITQSKMLDRANAMSEFFNQIAAPSKAIGQVSAANKATVAPILVDRIAESRKIMGQTFAANKATYVRMFNQMNDYNKKIMDIVSAVNMADVLYSPNANDEFEEIPAIDHSIETEAMLVIPNEPTSTMNNLDVLVDTKNKFWKRLLWNDKGTFKDWVISILMSLRNNVDKLIVNTIQFIILLPAILALLDWLGLLQLFKSLF